VIGLTTTGDKEPFCNPMGVRMGVTEWSQDKEPIDVGGK
jgi:hypothetical protein